MLKQWARYTLIIRVVGILLIAAILGVVGYQVYDFYSDRIGFTSTDAVKSYFEALGRADYAEVYRLTAKEDLGDIYGRRITRGEFLNQVKQVTGGYALPFQTIEVTKLFEDQGSQYYSVILTSSVGGTSGQSRLLVEVHRENDTWVVTYPFAIVL